MKRYPRNFRRKGNTVFFAVFGGILVGLGIAAYFLVSPVWAIVLCALGAVIAAVPQFFVHEGYRLDGTILRWTAPFAKKMDVSEVEAVVITAYDCYRRWKGFVVERFTTEGGESCPVPSVSFFTKIDPADLDLCDTRTRARLTYKKEFLFDAPFDFDFACDFARVFEGTVYVSDAVFAFFGEALKKIFGEKIVVFDRVPLRAKEMLKNR